MGIEVNFEGKIALITGASSGLGARFAKVLAKAGCQVVLASRRIERLKELRAQCKADHAKVGDDQCNAVAEATRRRFFGSGGPKYAPQAQAPAASAPAAKD